jgi:hypothetical protein
MDSVTVPHATQHADLNDAVEALEAKVGVDGSAVTSSLDYKVAQQGLTLITPSSVTGGTLSGATVSIGTGVTSVRVDGVFSAVFDNYKVIIADPDASTGSGVELRLGLGSASASYYGYTWGYQYTGTALAYARSNSSTPWTVGHTSTSANSLTTVEIGSPFTTRYTNITTVSTGSSYQLVGGGSHASNTSHTAITLYIGAGTFNGVGTIRVYGYSNG